MNIKEFIQQNLIIKYKNHFGLNSARFKSSWIKQNELFFTEIFNQTSFLSISCSLSERLYCVYNDIKEIGKCEICLKNLKYKSFRTGYCLSCGNHECTIKLKKIKKDKSGLTANQRTGIGISKAQRRILSDGKSVASHKMLTNQAKRKTTIDPTTGKTLTSLTAEKVAKTKENTILADGLNISQHAARQAAQTMKSTILSNGLSIYQNSTLKQMNTKVLKPKTIQFQPFKLYNSKIYYQGKLEKYFLNLVQKFGLIDLLEKPKAIKYVDYTGKQRMYFADFKILDKIFETKSAWTYDHRGSDLNIRKTNNLKWKATINLGFQFFVVWDKFIFSKIEHIQNIKDDLFNISKKDSIENFLIELKTYSKNV